MGKTTKNWDRKFLGKLKRFKDKAEQRKEQKHLKAYLKGNTMYTFGFREITNPQNGNLVRVPNMFPVEAKLIAI